MHSLCGDIQTTAKFEQNLGATLIEIDNTLTYPLSYDPSNADEFLLFWNQETFESPVYVNTTRDYQLCATLADYDGNPDAPTIDRTGEIEFIDPCVTATLSNPGQTDPADDEYSDTPVVFQLQ